MVGMEARIPYREEGDAEPGSHSGVWELRDLFTHFQQLLFLLVLLLGKEVAQSYPSPWGFFTQAIHVPSIFGMLKPLVLCSISFSFGLYPFVLGSVTQQWVLRKCEVKSSSFLWEWSGFQIQLKTGMNFTESCYTLNIASTTGCLFSFLDLGYFRKRIIRS